MKQNLSRLATVAVAAGALAVAVVASTSAASATDGSAKNQANPNDTAVKVDEVLGETVIVTQQ